MMKAWSGCITLVLTVLILANTVLLAQSANGFAVQVAAVQSRAEAVALVNGLRARGLHAYWVYSEVAARGVYFRIRVGGQFPNSKSATEFGRKLVQAGLVMEYAIFQYEPASDGEWNRLSSANTNITGHAPLPQRSSNRTGNAAVPPSPSVSMTSVAVAERSTTSGSRGATDYLISGAPETTASVTNREGGEGRAVSPSLATINSSIPMSGKEPVGGRPKHADEVELEDFKEFVGQIVKGIVEPRSNGLWVTLQNRNTRYRFRGIVKVAFYQQERERSQAPMQVTLEPGQEQSFEVPSSGNTGSYSLAVYDEQGGLQLLQQGSLGTSTQMPAERIASAPPTPPTAPLPTGFPGVGGGEVPVQSYEEAAAVGGLKTSGYPSGKPDEESEDGSNNGSKTVQPGDVKIVVRQIAASSENLTIEFEILAQQPLGMLTMSIRSNSMSDSKQAIMTTKQGRLPFLVPASDANGNISYELKDEQGRLLAIGSKALQELGK